MKPTWPSDALIDLLGIDLPIIQAPMAGAQGAELALAVAGAGGLGSLACAMLSEDDIRAEIDQICQATNRPFNLNFFCHQAPQPDPAADEAWRSRLAPYYGEFGIEAPEDGGGGLKPFGEAMCSLVEDLRPKVVSFHFGPPERALFERVKQAGAIVLASATTVAEARHLADAGVDAVIAQGAEAGGHRGMYLSSDISSQVGTLALVPQIVDAVDLPVIAAGGIADGRGLAAAFALGAVGAQIGTAYLFTPQARISELHRAALNSSRDDGTALTNVFTGRPARAVINRAVREIGPMAPDTPAFPGAASGMAPLRKSAELVDSADFSPLWSGQAGALGSATDAAALTSQIAAEARDLLGALASAEGEA